MVKSAILTRFNAGEIVLFENAHHPSIAACPYSKFVAVFSVCAQLPSTNENSRVFDRARRFGLISPNRRARSRPIATAEQISLQTEE